MTRPKPVMVWSTLNGSLQLRICSADSTVSVYGGSFAFGTGSIPAYDGVGDIPLSLYVGDK